MTKTQALLMQLVLQIRTQNARLQHRSEFNTRFFIWER